MRTIHPVRALRRSGWRSRALLAVVAAGLLAVPPLQAGPAEAHGSGVHRVIVAGNMHITDIDDTFFAPFPEICNVNKAGEARMQRTSSNPTPTVTVTIRHDCDEATAILRVQATYRADRAAVDTVTTARVEERDCVIEVACWTDLVGQKTARATILENVSGQFARTTIGNGDATVDFNFEIRVLS